MLELTEDTTGFHGLQSLPDYDPASQDIVLCQECGMWHQPDPSWRCPNCHRLAACAMQPGTCDRCGGACNCIRNGHLVRSLCLCHETDEQRALRLRSEAKARHEMELEHQAKQLAAERVRQQKQLRGVAVACWEAHGQVCTEPAGAFPECRFCARWQNARRNGAAD